VRIIDKIVLYGFKLRTMLKIDTNIVALAFSFGISFDWNAETGKSSSCMHGDQMRPKHNSYLELMLNPSSMYNICKLAISFKAVLGV
jgi:hypothetical protein